MVEITQRDKPMTPSEEIVARAYAADSITDKNGRVIGVKKLSALDKMRAAKLAGPEGSANRTFLGYIMTGLMVTSIDGERVPPPQSEIQVQAIIGRLDDEGVEAVNDWYSQKFGQPDESGIEELKNE